MKYLISYKLFEGSDLEIESNEKIVVPVEVGDTVYMGN